MAKADDFVKAQKKLAFRNAGEAVNLMDMLRLHNAFDNNPVQNVGMQAQDPLKR